MSHRAAPEIAPESSFDTTWYVRYTYAGPSDEDVNNFYRSKQHDPANDLGVNASGAFAARIVETLASAALVDRFGDPIAMSERPGLGRHTIPSGANETFSMLEVEAPYTDTLRHVALPVALPGARWNAAPAIADALSARVLPRTAGELAGVISKLWHREIGTTMRKAPFDRGGVGVDELVQGFAALGNVVVATAARRLNL